MNAAAEKLTVEATELAIVPEFQFSVFKLPEIEFNFDALDKSLDDTLAKYSNVVVTQESLPDDKKLAQELNAQAKAISNARIAKVKELAKPVDVFQVKMKALESKVLSVHKTINEQVKQFEELKLREIAAELDTLIKQEWESQGVAEQFRRATYADLIKLTSITGKGNFTAKTANEVKERVGKDKALQSQTQIRLLELENICYKNGMAAPLTESHVKPFLFESDELYNSALQQLIQSELEREARAVEAHRAKLEAEAKAKAQADLAVQQAQQAQQLAEQQAQQLKEQQIAQPVAQPEQITTPAHNAPVNQQQTVTAGKAIVTCTFEITVSDKVTDEAIIAKFNSLLTEAKFTTLQNISVLRG
jgi:hypothetical protein